MGLRSGHWLGRLPCLSSGVQGQECDASGGSERQLAGGRDDDAGGGLAARGADGFDAVHHVNAGDDSPEHDVLPVEPPGGATPKGGPAHKNGNAPDALT